MEPKIFKEEFFGRELTVEFSDLAEQTNGSALVRYGDTVVLVTAVMSNHDSDQNYFPLSVEYEEKFYAAGKIIGSRFIRREGRPSDEAVFTGRLIDRAIRPLFDQRLRREIQVVITVLSLGEVDADWPAFIGASAVLAASDIPWGGPIAGLRVAGRGDDLILNPTFEERAQADFDLFLSGRGEEVNMIEFRGNIVPEDKLLEAVSRAQKEFQKLIDFEQRIVAEFKPQKVAVAVPLVKPELKKAADEFLAQRLEAAVYTPSHAEFRENLRALYGDFFKHLLSAGFSEAEAAAAEGLVEEALDELVCKNILARDKRPDGRGLQEIRPLSCELDILPRVHGSAIFKRGATHSLSSVTLAAPGAEQMIETIEVSGTKRFIHHYNFPPYSTGEIGSFRRGPARRELGHGGLAERALFPIIPHKDEFPYTVRVVSEILSSNGSSSMASVCSSTLALMAAGVPIKAPAAGIAMGLITDTDGRYKILTDIQGPEDHHGDMDLKVAGTADGITAIQMDVKITGITLRQLSEILLQAREARLEILEKMRETLPVSRKELSPLAPQIAVVKIDPAKIGLLIGPGGKTINGLIAQYGLLSIDIDDDGSVFVAAKEEAALARGVAAVTALTREYKAGDIVEGTVSKIFDFGAVVDLSPFADGLLHISELANHRVEKVEDVVRLGDKVKVKIIATDPASGKISLSIKALRTS